MAQFTTTEVAEKFETTPRTLRKFLRADAKNREVADTLPGKGSRYAIEGRDLQAMKKRFKKWSEAEAKARAERLAEKAAEAEAKIAEETEADLFGEDPGDIDEMEPTDAELEEIDEEN